MQVIICTLQFSYFFIDYFISSAKKADFVTYSAFELHILSAKNQAGSVAKPF